MKNRTFSKVSMGLTALALLAAFSLAGCGSGGDGDGASAADTTAPNVSSTSPANSATNVAVNTAITATFSETMDTSTVSTATFTLNNGVTGAVIYTGTTATFTPSGNLEYSTTYTATITTGVKDAAGNAMASNYSWTFTTATAPGAAPLAPTGVSATAGNGQVTISWTAVTGATSYNIYWSISSGVNKTNGTKITGVTSPFIHTTGCENGTMYYIVTAVNSYGESLASSQVSAVTQTQTGTMQGVLLDSVTAEPIANAFITTDATSDTTKEDGTFILRDVPMVLQNDGTTKGTYIININLKNVTSPINMKDLNATPRYPDFSSAVVDVVFISLNDASDNSDNHDTPVCGYVGSVSLKVGKLGY